jgi:hypothetical protein
LRLVFITYLCGPLKQISATFPPPPLSQRRHFPTSATCSGLNYFSFHH